MKIKQETEEYQACVEALAKEVANTVIATLEAYSVPNEYIEKVKGELSFNVCSVIDGKELSVNGKAFTPNMAFIEDNTSALHLSVNGAFTKDYVYEFTED